MKVLRAAALAAVAGLVAGPVTSVAGVSAGPVAVSTIAVLVDDDFVDDGEEATEVIEDLEAGGHTVVEIEDVTAADFEEALEGANVLVIPELEELDEEEGAGSLADDLTEEAQAVITDWVDAGGRIVFFGSSDPTPSINDLFGFSLEQPEVENCGFNDEFDSVAAAAGDPCQKTPEAADTEWADGPATLGYVNDTTGLLLESLPADATVAYDGQGQEDVQSGDAGTAGEVAPEVFDLAAIASLPYGDGVVVYFGYDWYPEQAGGDSVAATVQEETDWATALDLGVSQPEVSASSPAAGALDLTMDSPSTQPVFVRLVINGTEHVVVIAAKTTGASFDVGGSATVEWDVPGWGIGEGTVEVAGATAAPPAEPAPAAPTFTG